MVFTHPSTYALIMMLRFIQKLIQHFNTQLLGDDDLNHLTCISQCLLVLPPATQSFLAKCLTLLNSITKTY